MRALHTFALIAFASLALGVAACGGSETHEVVVRVGGIGITAGAVDRWTHVVEHGGAFTGFRGAPRQGTPRERALALLISSHWLIGEARRRGMSISNEAVKQAIAERERAEGPGELRRRLADAGQTLTGLELEIRAELALEAISEELSDEAARVNPSELLAYYRRNVTLFSAPKAWVVDIVEGLPSASAATALLRRTGTGPGFTHLALHKHIRDTPGVLTGPANKKDVDRAIFSARPGVVSQPMRLNGAWAVFIVRRVLPPEPMGLASVRGNVLRHLRAFRGRSAKGRFGEEFVQRWRSRTICRPGYVAPGCSERHGDLGSYEDPF
jgi:hypothetical protein